MPDYDQNNANNLANIGLILTNLVDLKADVKSIEVKLDTYSLKSERQDAQIEMLSKQVTQFVPMNVLDERRAAYDKRLGDVESGLKDVVRKQEDKSDKNITRGISISAVLVAAATVWFNVVHVPVAQVLPTTSSSTVTSSTTTQQQQPQPKATP